MSKNIVIISNELFSLINFRGPLIKHLIRSGHQVYALVPLEKKINKALIQNLKNMGVNVINYYLSRNSINPFKDYMSYKSIINIISKLKPDVVIAYSAKPVIYTGLAMKYFSKINFFPVITGLGYGFTSGDEIKRKFIRLIMTHLYRFGLKNVKSIIFQNIDDKKIFYKLKIIKKKQLSHVVHGSGVDLDLYQFLPVPKKPVFLMLARLLIDKGVREYLEAANFVKARFPNTIFKLAGRLDSNPSSIKINELNFWTKKKVIQYLGEISPVNQIISDCRFYVLPSYREGTPRSVLEAMAIGRPIITTDVPGCRETVIHGKNGLLVQAKNSKSLANAMIKLLRESENKIQSMGKQSYLMTKKKYNVKKVNKTIVRILNL